MAWVAPNLILIEWLTMVDSGHSQLRSRRHYTSRHYTICVLERRDSVSETAPPFFYGVPIREEDISSFEEQEKFSY